MLLEKMEQRALRDAETWRPTNPTLARLRENDAKFIRSQIDQLGSGA